ncbi:MAG: alpha/beta hydrolase [Alphaproteobacteria bacterium]
MSITNFYEHKSQAQQPRQLVIMLHGVGSNGRDLISLAPYLAQYVPDAHFISPDAPFACDMVPAGYPDSYQWFSLQDRDPHVMLRGVESVFPLVEEFIKQQAERLEIPLDKVALLGFSQGTMTSLYTAPCLENKIAGVLGYSGALLWDNAQNSNDIKHAMPIHLIHGEADDVVPVQAWDLAQNTLKDHGFTVSGHTTPGLTHSIDQNGIESGGAFLKKILV